MIIARLKYVLEINTQALHGSLFLYLFFLSNLLFISEQQQLVWNADLYLIVLFFFR